ncbi:MAG: excinuclease ABC subunit UvrC [Hyphomicrobiales bacterium]
MSKNDKQHLQLIIKNLPDQPGIYQYFDKNGVIIYIGKAKNIKKRVSSYFNKDKYQSAKLKILVQKIEDIKYVVVNTEFDALLLENNLIKKYQPRYNILLKDDKTYPWICIKKEPFPRVFSTRNMVKDGSTYFGPYPSGKMLHALLTLIKELFPLRTCKLNLEQSKIDDSKYKVCLEYHIGNCLGPCVGKQLLKNYNKNVEEIKEILKGNVNSIIKKFFNQMMAHADKMEFEEAQEIKEKLELLKNYQGKSTVVNPKIDKVDVFGVLDSENETFINYLRILNGAIIQAHTVEIQKKLDEPVEELLSIVIVELRQQFNSHSKEIIVPFLPSMPIPDTEFTIPKIGDKKHLLELSERNAKFFKLEKAKKMDLVDPERHSNRILNRMMKDLRLKKTPKIIECFDNSNLQGSYPVAAMVQFINAKPNKKAYRHFNIKTVEGPNDYASMTEIIYRRYKRLQDEEKDLPDLIVVDGGKGQLNAALKSLDDLDLRGEIAIIGIAKRLEEIYFPSDPLPLYIDKTSETLKIIQQLRDEAHRFGITFHRKKRDKGTIQTELTNIKGIGTNTAETLLKKFKSVKRIKDATLEQLQSEIGKSKGKTVFDYFNIRK